MIIKRPADYKISQLTADAPVEYDTFAEIAEELLAIKAKLDLISITEEINLDNVTSELFGTIEDFNISLVTDVSLLPEGATYNDPVGTINDFEDSLI